MLTVSRDWINLFEGHFLTKTQVGHEAEVRTCEQSSLLCDGQAVARDCFKAIWEDKQTNISIANHEVVLRFVILSQEPGMHLPFF